MINLEVIANFFDGQIRLLLKRCQLLSTHLHALYIYSGEMELDEECKEYADVYKTFLSERENDLEALLADPSLSNEYLLQHQFGTFQDISRDIELVEWYVLSLLDHYNDKDHYLYKFIQLLCSQIKFPHPQPLVCAHSTRYFYTYLDLLICCPLYEDRFLLAAPYFAHELGHIFFNNEENSAILKPFFDPIEQYIQKQRKPFTGISGLFNSRKFRRKRDFEQDFERLEISWKTRYLYEFACDMFASYLIGPAFGWSHLRTIYTSELKLYRPGFGERGTHPSFEARMRGILLTLRELESTPSVQATSEVDTLSQHWEVHRTTVSSLIDDWPRYDYWLCYPDELLQPLAAFVIDICRDKNLVAFYDQPASEKNLVLLMQEGWDKFHYDPMAYCEWETAKIEELQIHLR